MSKPFHEMTPAERTAARIAQNRAIEEKLAAGKLQPAPARAQRPPASSSPAADYVRLTPEERAKLRGSLIRKVQS
jgi:hypothetical protein